MGTFAAVLLCFICCPVDCFIVHIGNYSTHTIDPDFFSLTADSSAFQTAASNATLKKLAAVEPFLIGLSPLTLRVGGTYTDLEVFPTGPATGTSPTGPTQLDFDMVSWAKVNRMIAAMPGSKVVVSVSGLQRHWNQSGAPWDSSNAESFIRANLKLGYNISGYELGNEPGCWNMHGGAVSPEQHALDFAVLRSVIKKVYSRQQTAPSVIGPDTTNCGGNVFNATIAESPDIDVATVHIYSVVPTANVEGFLHAAQTNAMCTSASAALTELNKSTLKGVPLWNGEGGASYLYQAAGGYLHQFGGALALLNNLGCLSAVGVSKLLKHDLFENLFTRPAAGTGTPSPVFWAGWLFKRLVAFPSAGPPGRAAVMPVELENASLGVHVYAFKTHDAVTPNVLMALNLGNLTESFESSLMSCLQLSSFALAPSGQATAQGHEVLNAPRMTLNGHDIEMQGYSFPDLAAWANPLHCNASVSLLPFSATFLVLG